MSILSTNLYLKLQKQYSRKINLNLKRVNLALEKLGQIQKKIKNPINIIGSDGKYSTLRSLQFIIEQNNQQVTTFTSPHLYDVRHRFWLKNRFIKINEIKKNINLIKKLKIKLTLFEVLTLVYFLTASKLKNVSYSLCESGLLFKGDSTRVWNEPRCQIITNINKQHLEWVKPKTLREICLQKVGYLSKKTTIYVGKQNSKTMKIIKSILKNNPSKKKFYGKDWTLKKKEKNIIYKDKLGKLKLKSKNILSDGIWDNVGLAIKVARDFKIPNRAILKAIPKMWFEGRMQYINKGKLKKILYSNEKLLIDGSHSETSAKNLISYLKNQNEEIYGVLGIQSHKEPEKFIKQFKKTFKKIIAINIPGEPNSCDPKKIKKILDKYNIKSDTAPSIHSALKKISNKKKKILCCFGSLYLCGKILSLN